MIISDLYDIVRKSIQYLCYRENVTMEEIKIYSKDEKKEIKLCDVIYNNVPEMKQQIKEVEDKEQEKEQRKRKK